MVNNAVKVFKKTSPNGKVTAYLNQRDFVDHVGKVAPVDGVLVVDPDYLKGRKIYARVAVTYRYGREDDEMMGMSFCKEFILVNDQVGPGTKDGDKKSEVQERLIKKLGENAHAFSVKLPDNAPASVTLDGGDDGSPCMGVEYELKFYGGSKAEEDPDRKDSIAFATRKVQYSKADSGVKKPQVEVSKGFTLSKGKLICTISLDKGTYYHGEDVIATLDINNSSKKTVKLVKCHAIQHVEVTMTKNQFTRQVAGGEFKEGCPITPGQTLNRKYTLSPNAQSNKKKEGIALDGKIKDKDSNLASSTLTAPGGDANDSLGIVVSYSLRVKLDCGKIAGELVGDLPFTMVYADPNAKGGASSDDIAFEDFKKLRRGKSIVDD